MSILFSAFSPLLLIDYTARTREFGMPPAHILPACGKNGSPHRDYVTVRRAAFRYYSVKFKRLQVNKLGFFFGKTSEPEPSAAANGEKRLRVDPRRCPQNHPCPAVRVCPTNALKQSGYGLPSVDMETCITCGKCVRYCPMGAISVG